MLYFYIFTILVLPQILGIIERDILLYFYIFTVIVLPQILSILSPTWMIYLLALTGPLLVGADASSVMGFIFGKIDITSLRIVGTIIGSLFIIMRSFGKSVRFLKFGLPYILFLIIISVSLTWAPSVMYGARTIVKLAALFLIMVAVGVTIDDEKKLNRFMNIITFCCTISALVAIYSKMSGLLPDSKLTLPNMSPAVFSANMLVGLIVALNKNFRRQTLKWVLVIGYIAVILAADTRITIGAMFVIISVYGYFKMKGLLKLAIPVASVTSFLMLFLLVDKFRNRMFIGTKSVSIDSQTGINNAMGHLAGSGRFSAWDFVIDKFFMPNMVMGSGIGTTQNFYYSTRSGIGAIHSEYVRLLAETGLVGTFLFLLSMFIYFVIVRHKMKKQQNNKYIYIMAVCSVIAYLTFMATDNAFDYVNQFGFYIFGLIGVAIAFPDLSPESPMNNGQDAKMSENGI